MSPVKHLPATPSRITACTKTGRLRPALWADRLTCVAAVGGIQQQLQQARPVAGLERVAVLVGPQHRRQRLQVSCMSFCLQCSVWAALIHGLSTAHLCDDWTAVGMTAYTLSNDTAAALLSIFRACARLAGAGGSGQDVVGHGAGRAARRVPRQLLRRSQQRRDRAVAFRDCREEVCTFSTCAP